MASSPAVAQPPSPDGDSQTARWVRWLVAWVVVYVGLQGLMWSTGVRKYELADAVERGAARVEERLTGEETRDVIRKQIQLQRDSLHFWTVVAALGDFLCAPLGLVLRVVAVAVSFSAAAALTGRRVRFPDTLTACAQWQGVWVLGLAVQLGLMLWLRRDRVDTTVLAVLPPTTYSASTWVGLRQLDLFAMWGWFGMAYSGWHRQQANGVLALGICLVLAAGEATIWASAELLVQLSTRLTLLPG